jgi:hypothetical protein
MEEEKECSQGTQQAGVDSFCRVEDEYRAKKAVVLGCKTQYSVSFSTFHKYSFIPNSAFVYYGIDVRLIISTLHFFKSFTAEFGFKMKAQALHVLPNQRIVTTSSHGLVLVVE